MYSPAFSSYLVLYFSGSERSPLLRAHVMVGFGSPDTTALKVANLPAISTN